MQTRFVQAFALTLGVSALSATMHASAAGLAPFSSAATGAAPAPWRVAGLPERYAKPLTSFEVVRQESSNVLKVQAEQSWGTLVHEIAQPIAPNTTLRWRWRLDQGLAKADVRSKATEDSPLKVCVSYALPIEAVPGGERTLIKLVQFFTRDKIPLATLCYTWGNKESIGAVLDSPVTRRVRYIVLSNEGSPLKNWISFERNIHADFLKVFGQEAQAVPALGAIIVGADSDNTSGSSLGYVGDLQIGLGSSQ